MTTYLWATMTWVVVFSETGGYAPFCEQVAIQYLLFLIRKHPNLQLHGIGFSSSTQIQPHAQIQLHAMKSPPVSSIRRLIWQFHFLKFIKKTNPERTIYLGWKPGYPIKRGSDFWQIGEPGLEVLLEHKYLSKFAQFQFVDEYAQNSFSQKNSHLIPVTAHLPALLPPPAPWVDIKSELTSGIDYFFYYGKGMVPEVLTLLKGFSLFKKRQQSQLKLVIGLQGPQTPRWIAELATYKFRQDVLVLYPSATELGNWFNSAYACLLSKDFPLLLAGLAFTTGCTLIGEAQSGRQAFLPEGNWIPTWSAAYIGDALKKVYTQELIQATIKKEAQAWWLSRNSFANHSNLEPTAN